MRDDAELYGATAQEWLDRWDAGETVWSIEMGGMGPGYEQAIQVMAAELLRILIAGEYDAALWEDDSRWAIDKNSIQNNAHENKTIIGLEPSGAQYGAALNLAIHLYRQGPVAVFNKEQVKDRHIQISKKFPI